MKVQLSSDLLNQRAATAAVRSDYEQAKLQHEVDDQLQKQALAADVTAKLSKVRAEQLAISAQLEDERTKNAAATANTRLAAQQAPAHQQQSLHNLRRSQRDAL